MPSFCLRAGGKRDSFLSDLMATHAHRNPLWVMAYDDYPMTSVFFKEKSGTESDGGTIWVDHFYHDEYYRAIKWDKEGDIVAEVRRQR